ncbi:DUF5007 domain-containing protein [Chitinophaga arvensicola]|uniref:DUF5007 domain-containing protein n=1 Tax=Chitinophaga arvensicola TaxID=29529 RepID=A0A1I0R6T9_9BACT|nr:DUF5007 domain-containing protein [Chitinophaga arvensicola]SEW36337.1 protein of unknown function [Chitinophaga arvensicola]
MKRQVYTFFIAGALAVTATSCYKELLPKEKEHFSNNVNFDGDTYTANFGRTNVFYGKFNADNSTQPLTFQLLNIHRPDSQPAPELLTQVDTWQWKAYYSGTEKTIAEIDAKRFQVKRPVLDMRENSGDLVFWATDTSKIKPGVYTFDILVKNNGGQKLFQKQKLQLRLPRPYEPYDYDDITGLHKKDDKNNLIYNHPTLEGVQDMQNNTINADQVNVYFHKTGTGKNSVTFKVYDKDSVLIPMSKFNVTQWDSLKYVSNTIGQNVFFGFNRKFATDSSTVTWDITNPYPVLADVGINESARVTFTYERVSYGQRRRAYMGYGFSILEPGSWEIIFKFRVNPKFIND